MNRVQVDVSAYTGPTMAVGWDPLDIDGGDIAPIEPVMLDGGRTQPVSVESRRSKTPALDAGRALAVALGVDPNTVTVLPRDRSVDGTEIASVQSPPLMQRLRDMMNFSDNVMAESIGREVAVALSRPASFDGAARSVLATLDDAGIDTSGARLFDSSGLSVDDRLTALTLDEIVTAAVGDSAPALRPLVDLVPIAGGSGTLSNRYLDTAAAGYLRGKTGSLTALPVIDERLARRGAPDQPLERANELRALLAERIAALKPRDGGEFGTTEQWRHYNSLYFPYVVGVRAYAQNATAAGLDPVARQAWQWLVTDVPQRSLHNWQNAAARVIATDLRSNLVSTR